MAERPRSAAPPTREIRADAVELITGGAGPELFTSYDPDANHAPGGRTAPLFDLRVVEFLLSLPPIPWAVDKTILRQTARARSLPESISARPKSPLAGDPRDELLRRSGESAEKRMNASAALGHYVVSERLPSLAAAVGTELLWPLQRALSLEHWLCSHSLDG